MDEEKEEEPGAGRRKSVAEKMVSHSSNLFVRSFGLHAHTCIRDRYCDEFRQAA